MTIHEALRVLQTEVAEVKLGEMPLVFYVILVFAILGLYHSLLEVLREILTGIPSILPVVRAILKVIVYVLCLLVTLLRWYTWGPFDPPLDIRRERIVGK
jgi:hypothetical protein